jgi:DNA-binding transcriptional LysR family regulator
MDVRQLEMFRAVVEEGGFTRASEKLHVSQSAISRQLKLLEEELGTLLLQRTGRGVILTPQGEILLRTANRIQRDLQEVAAQISDTHKLQRGMIHLGGGMTVCLNILPKLLKKFRTLYENIDLHLTAGTAEDLLRRLRAHEIDLLLLTLPQVAPDLEVIPVLKEEMVVVTGRNHPLTKQRVIDPRNVARYPLLLFESGSNSRKVIDEFFFEREIPMEVIMETENVEIIKAMVASGLGVAILPYTAIAADVRSRRFAWSRLRGERLYRETGWVYLKAAHRPHAIGEVLRLFNEMKNEFGGRPGGSA